MKKLFVVLFLGTLATVSFNCYFFEKKTKIEGRVISVATNQPVAGAAVAVGDDETLTDDNGYFRLSVKLNRDDEKPCNKHHRKRHKKHHKGKKGNKCDIPPADPCGGSGGTADIIRITGEGYVPYQNSLKYYTGDRIVFNALLMPVGVQKTIDPGAPGDKYIGYRDGAAVTIPQLSGISENLVVSLTSFNVSTDDIRAISGDWSAVNAGDTDVNLISQGVIDVTITGADTGNNYSLEGYGTYGVRIPISGDIATAPDTIPLWSFDDATNKWVESGSAAKNGTFYEGTVTHFSLWNCDIEKVNNACITGTIGDTNPVVGEVYEMTLRMDGYLRTHTQTDTSIEIINLPQNEDMTLEIVKTSNGDNWVMDITTPGTTTCLDLGSIFGGDWLPEVKNLTFTRASGQVTLDWNEPSLSGFTGVEITYSPNLFEMPSSPISVSSGTTTQTVTMMNSVLYTFTVKAIYATGQSYGITRNLFIYNTGSNCDLTVNIIDSVGTNSIDYVDGTSSINFSNATNTITRFCGTVATLTPAVIPPDGIYWDISQLHPDVKNFCADSVEVTISTTAAVTADFDHYCGNYDIGMW